jgi:hypothetical protein
MGIASRRSPAVSIQHHPESPFARAEGFGSIGKTVGSSGCDPKYRVSSRSARPHAMASWPTRMAPLPPRSTCGARSDRRDANSGFSRTTGAMVGRDPTRQSSHGPVWLDENDSIGAADGGTVRDICDQAVRVPVESSPLARPPARRGTPRPHLCPRSPLSNVSPRRNTAPDVGRPSRPVTSRSASCAALRESLRSASPVNPCCSSASAAVRTHGQSERPPSPVSEPDPVARGGELYRYCHGSRETNARASAIPTTPSLWSGWSCTSSSAA